MSIELKIKAKSLAAEALLIRREERKQLGHARWSKAAGNQQDAATAYWTYQRLHNHRKHEVRNEARWTHLARAFIKGLPYSAVETKPTRRPVDVSAVSRMVKAYHLTSRRNNYGPGAIRDWIDA